MRAIIYMLFVGCLMSFDIQASAGPEPLTEVPGSFMDSIPPVFLIGQYSEECEKLNLQQVSLLQVCQDEVLLAYDKWMYMLADLNDLSSQFGIDLKGCKFWFSVYYHKDGTIKHFSYFLKPGSKKIDAAVFNPLLLTFISNYKMPIAADQDYSNYGSAVFPIAYRKPLAHKN
ncbi:MAG: hypothetical protein SH818_11115 [Saprospiraceae bacterium]|nr:hypothetical protein [Saprospiraceae bacterium]